MLSEGLEATLGTDDPGVSKITLSREYQLACEQLGLSLAVIRARILAAARAAFLPIEEKRALIERLTLELDEKIPQL
jgi:adenosine deaminase